MKRLLFASILVLLVTFLSACHLFQSFIVVNNSGENIDVQYQLKDSAFQGGRSGFDPEFTSLSNLNAWRFFQKNWEKLPEERYNFDRNTRIYSVKLAPQQVVKISQADAQFLREDSNRYFEINSLKISGNNKEINFDDSRKLLTEFQTNDYQINYR